MMTSGILARCRILCHNEFIMLRQILRETAFVVFFSIAALLLTIVTSCGYSRATPSPSPAPIGADSLQQPVRYHVAYEISF